MGGSGWGSLKDRLPGGSRNSHNLAAAGVPDNGGRSLTPDAEPRTDADLVTRARAGDEHAFGMLVARHARGALAIARGVLGDPDAAEDVCQDAIFRAWQRLEDCREPDRFGAWLARTVHRHALNAVRRKPAVSLTDADELADPGRSPDHKADAADLRRRLDQALRLLSAEQRAVVLLFDLEDWSHASIADALDTTEAMSRQHLMLARRRLRQLLSKEELR